MHRRLLQVLLDVVHAQAHLLDNLLVLGKLALVDSLILITHGLIEAKVELFLSVGRRRLQRLASSD